ncbi:YhdP family protein [Thermomonas brevis]
MTAPLRRRLRLLRRGAWYAVALVLVALALGNGVASQLLPLAERHPQRIAAWLGKRAGAPVAFDHVQTQWTRRGPLLRLDNLRVGEGDNPVRIGDAEVLVAQYVGWLPGRSLTELRLRGLDLTLQRDPQGRWSVRGLPGQQQGGDPFAMLERLGELQVSHARLHVSAPELGLSLRLPRIDLRLQVDGQRIRGGADAWLRESATPFEMALDLQRGSGDGRVYAGSRQADLAELAGALQVAGISPAAGKGRTRIWLRLQGRQVVALHADADLQDVVLRGTPLAGEGTPTRALQDVVLAATWTRGDDGWHLRVPRLRLGEGQDALAMDGIAVDGGRRFRLQAPRLDAGPLLQLLALGDAAAPGLRGWLRASAPAGVLHDVQLHGQRGGPLQASARAEALRFDPVRNTPGMRGISGWLQGDAAGLRMRFDPQVLAAFDWPAGFGVVHEFRIDGEALLWRDGGGWTVRTPGLALDGERLHVRARGGIGFEGDGTRPRLDLAAEIGDVPVTMASGFWVHHLMPKSTVQWLDAALRGGILEQVRAVVVGDLDDWPFRNEPGKAGAGLFRADARMRGGTLKFQPDWPAIEDMNAELRFVADGFSVDGSGRIGGVPIERVRGGISRFGRAELQLDAATAATDARHLLSLLRNSPLHKEHGEVLDNLRAAGPARADLHLLLPFHRKAPPPRQVRGNVALDGAQLQEARWDIAFDQVRGQARYDETGFIADPLQVRHEGRPAQLALRAGPAHARDDANNAFEAELRAQADIDGLLDKAPTMAWLKPHLRGSSQWTVEVATPRAVRNAALLSRLRLRSNLAGTAIDLPEPLRKPAAQALPAVVDIQLPIERGEVEVTLERLLSIRSRSNGNRTGVQVQLGGARAEAPPAHGMLVGGQVERLDALDWIGVATAGRDADDGGVPLRRLDVQARRLQLLGADFGDSRLQLAPAPRGMAVQVQGPALAGALLVPSQDGATVAGRFERLHWKGSLPGQPPPAANARVATPATPAQAIDPAKVPPLLLDVTDLRIGNLPLGQARLRTTPTAAGLRMDEFATRGGKQRLAATGAWTGRGDAARTRLGAEVDSDDIGSLLAGLGLAGQVDAGKGRLGMTLEWRGAPAELSLAALQGDITLDARNGRLLEIEPGAGRVLGLLGIAQLPRRLTLDFRDFFDKGFAFDRIRGNVRVADGVARTSDLAIEGPAAEIHVSGSADLVAQRFDQTVEVQPKSGGLLTAVGAIAGGPVGAAVGAVANAVLDKPLQQAGARTYRVTGPWNAPKVESRERTRNPPPAPIAPEPPG